MITKTATGAIFRVRVQPEAGKNEIIGAYEDAFKIRISAPPVKGKANTALIDFLAEKLGVKRSEVEIISGHTSETKKIKVLGEAEKIEKRINEEIASLRSQSHNPNKTDPDCFTAFAMTNTNCS